MGHTLGKRLGNDATWDTRLLALLNNLELEEYYLNGDEDKTLYRWEILHGQLSRYDYFARSLPTINGGFEKDSEGTAESYLTRIEHAD